jgi:hypothetical protein
VGRSCTVCCLLQEPPRESPYEMDRRSAYPRLAFTSLRLGSLSPAGCAATALRSSRGRAGRAARQLSSFDQRSLQIQWAVVDMLVRCRPAFTLASSSCELVSEKVNAAPRRPRFRPPPGSPQRGWLPPRDFTHREIAQMGAHVLQCFQLQTPLTACRSCPSRAAATESERARMGAAAPDQLRW